jgi:hypothetical protein
LRGTAAGRDGRAVWFSLEAPDMLSRAKARWANLSLDDRVVLSLAFHDAMKNPDRVADYKWKYQRLESGHVIVIHEFRLGFSNFTIITANKSAYIYDLWVDPGIALAAE